jgi:hypothetical protein
MSRRRGREGRRGVAVEVGGRRTAATPITDRAGDPDHAPRSLRERDREVVDVRREASLDVRDPRPNVDTE